MPESYSFAKTRVRLEEIVSQVRKKDTSLEKSLDLLEEGVRLANQCTELIDHADWEAAVSADADAGEARSAEDAHASGVATNDGDALSDTGEEAVSDAE